MIIQGMQRLFVFMAVSLGAAQPLRRSRWCVWHDLEAVSYTHLVFSGGYIIYDENAAKELMAIPDELLEAHTLYSSEAADAMARKLHEKTGCRMCAAITGVAGPDPVGDIAPGMYNISVLFYGKLSSRCV